MGGKGAITFLLVNFAWVFFRMPNIGDAFAVICKMFSFGSISLAGVYGGSAPVFMVLFAISILFFKDLKDEFFSNRFSVLGSTVLRWSAYVTLFVMILLCGVLDGGSFIYVSF